MFEEAPQSEISVEIKNRSSDVSKSNSYNVMRKHEKDSSTIPSYVVKSTTGKSGSGDSSDIKTFQLNPLAVSDRVDVRTNSANLEDQASMASKISVSKPNT